MKFLWPPLKIQSVLLVSMFLLAKAGAQTPDPSQAADTPQPYSITDLGTLGGSSSAAAGMAGQQGHNAAGMIVGTSTAADNTAHAFLYSNGQMRDLNELCDLSTSDFNVLTTASSIDDAGQIIGAGITASGQTHAFLLKPTPVDGGNWSYSCCQWIWKQGSSDSSTNNNSGGSPDSGWWWESNCRCYNWHGPPGKHPPCPSNPPHCWYWPLPCSSDMGCSPYPPAPKPNPTVTPTPIPGPKDLCWCCAGNGDVVHVYVTTCAARGGQCYSTQAEAETACGGPCYCCRGNGDISLTTAKNCRHLGGQCFATHAAALAQCGPTVTPTPKLPPGEINKKLPKCWCCRNGVVSEISRFECTASGGQCYASEAEAKSKCVGSGYCCANNIISTVAGVDVCLSKGGTFSPTYKEALENCGPTCWCCINLFEGGSEIIQTTRTQCIQLGHNCYETLALAQTECSGEPVLHPDAVYCCSGNGTNIKGPVGLNECRDAGGVAFPTFNAALDHCHPGDLWLQQTDSYKTTIPHDPRFPLPPTPNLPPPNNPRIPNTPNGQLQPSPTPEVTPFRRRQPQSSPNPRRNPSNPVPQGTPISTPNPTPIFHRPHATPTPPRQRPLHRSLNKPKPTPTPPIVR